MIGYVERANGTLDDYAQRNRHLLSDSLSIPLYYQLFRLLERFIFERHLRPKERFPSEESIAAAFVVSRPTANRATRELLDRGWLRRERGRGTFVGCGSHVELTLLSDELSLSEQLGHESRLESRAVYCRTGKASSELADALKVPDGTPTIELRRVRYIDRCPILVSDAFLPAERVPNFGAGPLIDGSLFATLRERCSAPVARCERWIETSEALAQDVADLLQIPVLAPLLLVRGLAYTWDEEPIAFVKSYVREGVSFQVTARPHAEPNYRTVRTLPEAVEHKRGQP
jgi:GntR family transcriptional regulator